MRNRLSPLVACVFLLACGSSSSGGDSAGAGGSGAAGAASGGSGGASAGAGGAAAAGAAGSSAAGMSAAGAAGMAGGPAAAACMIPAQVVGSCAVKDASGNYQSCVVYWGTSFTPDVLKAACLAPTLGMNICPSAGSVGACESSDAATGLANYYYNAGDGTPANQAQCNSNPKHEWCNP